MTAADGGENETGGTAAGDALAPVIPLFGRRAGAAPARTTGAPARPAGEPGWHASWVDDARVDDASADPTARPSDASRVGQPTRTEEAGRAHRPTGPSGPAGAHGSSRPRRAERPGGRRPSLVSFVADDGDHDDADEGVPTPEQSREAAESTLLRRLRTRQLSVSEARSVVTDAGLTPDAADGLLSHFERLGYLDDAALAEQLVHAAVTRKGQGRQAIGPMLNKRGIPRDVADAAVAALPDDDLERALEFARTKARSLGSRDRDTALRRLMGQLARRGYPSSVSLAAAKQALDEL